ncbi:ATP-dependent sacrificial sulfur transferase LarE [soil metagenome]
MEASVAAKHRNLEDRVRAMKAVVVAYSGGVDSSLVAGVAHEVLGDRALAVTAVSAALARRDLDEAASLAGARGWRHRTVSTHEGRREGYVRNAQDRCYWCKTELFETLAPLAAELDAVVVTGTNADDLSDHRPGLLAAAEHSIRAPLAEAGLAKSDVRALARAMGLPTADKPASPCLASRFAYGVKVTPEGLRRVERAEEAVRAHGFADLRVRDHGDLARIEVPRDEVERAAALSAVLADALRELGWRYVTLDLMGFRSGSLNEVLAAPTLRGRRTTSSTA